MDGGLLDDDQVKQFHALNAPFWMRSQELGPGTTVNSTSVVQ